MANKNKIINQAQKHISKGQWDKAIKELQKLVAEDPNDVRTLLKLGDVYSKKGDRESATRIYKQVAESYSEQGFFLKAVAVYKQILKHDVNHLDVTLKLAELYEHLGLTSEAMGQYQRAAQIHDEKGSTRDSLDVLKRMVELDEDNVASRIKLAESYSRESMVQEAIQEFHRASDILKQQNRIEDYVKVAERLVYHDPTRLDVIKELAKLYLERNDTKRGLAKLQLCFKAEPSDIETLTLLAKAFIDLGQTQKTIFVYRELARTYSEQGMDSESQSVLQQILTLDPNDQEARASLGYADASAPTAAPQPKPNELMPSTPHPAYTGQQPIQFDQVPGTGSRPGLTPHPDIQQFDPYAAQQPVPQPMQAQYTPVPQYTPPPAVQAPVEPLGQFAPPPGAGFADSQFPDPTATGSGVPPDVPDEVLVLDEAPPSAPPPSEPKADDSVAISKILTETDVYIKYGLRDKALEHLRKVFDVDPDNSDTYLKMRDIFLAQGDSSRAAEAIANVIHIYSRHGNPEVDAMKVELEQLAPGHPLVVGGAIPGSAMPGITPGFDEQEDSDNISIDITEDSGVFDLVDVADGEIEDGYSLDLPSAPSVPSDQMEEIITDHGAMPESQPEEPWPSSSPAADLLESQENISDVDILDASPLTFEEPVESGEYFAEEGQSAEEMLAGELQMAAAEMERAAAEMEMAEDTHSGEYPTPVPPEPEMPDALNELDAAAQEALQSWDAADDYNADDYNVEAYNVEAYNVEDVDGLGAVPEPPVDFESEAETPQPNELEALIPEDETPSDLAPIDSDAAQIADVDEGGPLNDAIEGGLFSDADMGVSPEFETGVPTNPSSMPSIVDETDDSELMGDTEEPTAEAYSLPPDDPFATNVFQDEDTPVPQEPEIEPELEEPEPEPEPEPAPVAIVEPNPELEDELDEVEFLVEAGLTSEAEESLTDILSRVPGYPRAIALMKAVGGAEPSAETPEETFETDDFSKDLDSAFDDVEAGDGLESDPQDHYDQGIMFRGIGRLDEAIAEFQEAAKSPSRAIDALEMIGHCLMDQNDPGGAITHFNQALELDTEGRAAVNLKYEIGAAYEMAGENEGAVEWFRACHEDDPTHRDVVDRLKALGAPDPGGGGSTPSNGAFSSVDADSSVPSPSKKNKISYL